MYYLEQWTPAYVGSQIRVFCSSTFFFLIVFLQNFCRSIAILQCRFLLCIANSSTYMYKVKSENEVAQSCRTLCDSMDCSLPVSSIHGVFQARVGCHYLLQGIFPTQGLNPGLPHCKQRLYRLSHLGSPFYSA